ncbi:MAG TPA: UDP-glucuronic acid decarboxylase family protein [Pseudobacteroides sp.]|uniref:UDP-glucuronic acid decarboxylase family protein n=1 Tax=Pseudobacteroides sp. TaxID=1968840 RepID=UPI002F9436C4
MKRILVTGGAGFIGSHLCRRLLQLGNEVICMDNLYSGRKSNINDLLGQENFNFVFHDIETPISLDVDEIYNLACPASPVYYQRNPIKTVKTSVLGAINMLEMATMSKARILQASTSEVYGDPVQHPQTERYWGNVNPIGIRSCYDEGKRTAETLFMDYHRRFGTDIRIVRIFNTYGPYMRPDDGRVVSNFIVQALNNDDITVYGDGTQTRSFCYIDDLIEGLIKMMKNDIVIGPVNLGNPNEFTVLDLANKVISQVGSKSQIVYKPLPQDDPKQRKADIYIAKEQLNWAPKIQIEEGVVSTINYFIGIMGAL